MSDPVTRSIAPPPDEDANSHSGGAAVTASGDEEFALNWRDQQFLNAVVKFLTTVCRPKFIAIATAHGYTGAEQEHAWALYSTVLGMNQSFDHVFAQQGAVGADSARETLVALDEFENLWFPRTRMIIRRVVAEDRAAQFESAFFQNLQQQRVGPMVIVSVRTYLDRVAQLATSTTAGARDVADTLRRRGLTDAVVTRVRAQLKSVSHLAPTEAAPAADIARAAEVARTQCKALRDLRAWYNDWSTTLRSAYTRKQLIQLGLSAMRTGSAAASDEDDAGEAQPPSAPAVPVTPAAPVVTPKPDA
jgi:hypothetical protein